MRGDDGFEAGIPESFNVLVKEMRALGMHVDLIDSEVEAIDEETVEGPQVQLPPAAE